MLCLFGPRGHVIGDDGTVEFVFMSPCEAVMRLIDRSMSDVPPAPPGVDRFCPLAGRYCGEGSYKGFVFAKRQHHCPGQITLRVLLLAAAARLAQKR
jgi:hypothetical protein